MHPVLSSEDFISPKDKAGRDLFYRVSNFDGLPKGTTVYLVMKRVPDTLLETAKIKDITVQKLEQFPMQLYQKMCYTDKMKWRSYVFS